MTASYEDRSDETRATDVQLRTFPSRDRAFRAFARTALLRTVVLTPFELQTAIRARYPAAIVRVQDELARRDQGVVWYAFRYGSVADAPADPAFDWQAPDVAEALVDDQRRFLEVNDSLVAIVELPRAEILGRAIEDFTSAGDPTIRDDVAALWKEFLRAGVAESTIRFNRVDGRPRELAYRIVANDPGPGQHRLRVHEVERPTG